MEKVVKIAFLICGLILIGGLLTSCTTGVSPQAYDKAIADLEETGKVSTLEAKVAELEALRD